MFNQLIERKDRTKTEDYLTLIDNYNELIRNVNIVYQLVEEPIQGLIELLMDETEPKNFIVENAVSKYLTEQVTDIINSTINTTLGPKVEMEVEAGLDAFKIALQQEFEVDFQDFRDEINTRINNLEISVTQQVNTALNAVSALQNNINTLVQNSIAQNLDPVITDLINNKLDAELLNYIRRIPKGEPTGAALTEGAIWFEIDE
jgi:hypothetical protein